MPPTTRTELLWACESDSVRARLLEHSESVFATETNQVRVWSSDSFDERDFHAENDLNPPDQTVTQPYDIFFNIQQAHSWDRLSVSSATFKKIVERYEVFPYFLQAVQGFELRDRSDTSTWNNFHLREGHSATEACYTLHYVEHNGRTRGDPWSFRKTAVYHRSDVQTQSSTWILVKLPSPLKGRLVDRLKKLWQETELCHARNLMVHILILAYSLQGWREYLDSLKLKMEDLEEKCLFSRADVTSPYDYAVRFSDLQSIQLLRRKLTRSISSITSVIGVIKRVQAAFPKLLLPAVQSTPLIADTLKLEVEDLAAEAEYYHHSALELQQRSSDAASLLSGMLEYRNGVASEKSLKAMEEMSVNAEMERSLGQKSATNVRALTVVATLYLPASLLAGVFSTPLIHAESGGPLVASAEFWKFFVVLLPMMAVTFFVVDLLQTMWTVRDDKRLTAIRRQQQAGQRLSAPKRRGLLCWCFEAQSDDGVTTIP